MTSRFSYGRIAHAMLWCGLAVASLAVSIPKIYSGATAYPLRPTGPLHTCDSYLKFATGASGVSKDLISIFQSITASKRVIIFTRKDDAFSSGLGMTSAYLASPHLVRLFEINGTHPDNELSKMNPDEVAAVVFCRINRPAWLPAGKVFGSGLEVVSMPETVRR
ncbi:MAG: hypothetical protein DME46_07945 [Verrucomicrobia bacterium]|nr:MAG: hypothetical protein DME46_07945 [Verrucomicrobiota bacterium]PYM10549.1 MAG: hypothetical protein DMF15_01745 [Verrucomicrobiota bacterium]